MEILGVTIGFIIIVVFNSRKINMTISLFIGAITAAFISGIELKKIFIIFYQILLDPLTVRLMIIIGVISGMGYLLKKNGSLNKIMGYLFKYIKNGRILSLLIPALIGTLAVPGGAIMSAPIVEKSGNRINLDQTRKTAINVFGRHIGFLIYPLYTPLIISSELAGIAKISIIKYNIPVLLIGLPVAYYVFFNNHKSGPVSEIYVEKEEYNFKSFIIGLLPIILILFLGLVLHIPFQISVFAGLLIGTAQNISGKSFYGNIFSN